MQVFEPSVCHYYEKKVFAVYSNPDKFALSLSLEYLLSSGCQSVVSALPILLSPCWFEFNLYCFQV